MMKNTDYIIGINAGTNSVGYSATDLSNNLLHLVHGRTAIGTRIFKTRDNAKERRTFRSSRRNLDRKQMRLRFFNQIMFPKIAELDSEFENRLKQSNVSPIDIENKKYSTIIFPTKEEEVKFYKKYPTIYHLQQKMMTEDRKFDLREVYIALHGLLKHRGNFLLDTPVNSFKGAKINAYDTLKELNGLFKEIGISDLIFNLDKADEIENVLEDTKHFTRDKSKVLKKIFAIKSKNRSQETINKKIITQMTNALLGYKVKFDILLNKKEIDNSSEWSISLNDSEIDSKLAKITPFFNEFDTKIIDILVNWYSSLTLKDILGESATVAEAMVEKYEKHKEDYELLKKYAKSVSDKEIAQKLIDYYTLYIGSKSFDSESRLEIKKRVGKKSLDKDQFYGLVKKVISNQKDNILGHEILAKIELNNFMPKQRTKNNAAIPYQLNTKELNLILEKQAKYYPFLGEPNPVKNEQDRDNAPYKISQLMVFKVPYYVGPLVTPEEQKEAGISTNSRFAWLVRKEAGKITPWNFYEKVDLEKTADRFIKRLIANDTYIPEEKVLPRHSFIYEKYTVLNELNGIKVNNKKLSVSQKQALYNDVFKKYKTVTEKRLKTYLEKNLNHKVYSITGLSENKFNSSLDAYLRLKKIFGEKIDDLKLRSDFENMVEWLTVFEDQNILETKIRQEIAWISETELKQVITVRLTGWGRLSKTLLTQIIPQNGNSILATLWNTKLNFMQIINKPAFKQEIANWNRTSSNELSDTELIEQAYISPDNKKAINQALRVVEELVQKAEKAPKIIALKYNRGPKNTNQLMISRQKRLLNIYNTINDSLISDELMDQLLKATDKKLLDRKLYLYFLQAGRDALTGELLQLESISKYQISHILPPSFVSDESFNNLILTKSTNGIKKGEKFAIEIFANDTIPQLNISVKDLWKRWNDLGLMPNKKYNNILTNLDTVDRYQELGYANNQLTDNNVVLKLLALLLNKKYPNSKIILVKNNYLKDIRKQFNLYRLTELNAYYHGMDAYITGLVANYLYHIYPNMRSFFTYGEYYRSNSLDKNSVDESSEIEVVKNLKNFNFLWKLLYGNEDQICMANSQKQIFSRKEIIDQLKKVYDFKYQNVSQEVFRKNGALFNRTMYPAPRNEVANTRKLIPLKKNLDPEIYGGYSSEKNAAMALIKIETTADAVYQLVGIPQSLSNSISDNKKLNAELKKRLTKDILYSSTGKRKKKIKDFEIIKNNVPYHQIIIDGSRKFMVGSPRYLYPVNQLVLSSKANKILADLVSDPQFISHYPSDVFTKSKEKQGEQLQFVYQEIINLIKEKMPIFEINKTLIKLEDSQKVFRKVDNSIKIRAIRALLLSTQANAASGDMSCVGINAMTLNRQITLTDKAIFVYQSPTGLTEIRRDIKTLR